MISNTEKPALAIKRLGRPNLHIRILTALLLSSALLNIMLARKIKDLNYAILYLKGELSSARGLNAGDKAPPIQAKDIDGQPATVMYPGSDSPSIIYVFTPSCVWCTRNLNNMKMLFIQTKANYRFIGLSLSSDGLREYASQYSIDFPVYTDLTGESTLAYKGGTPRTLVVSPDGIILKSWFGAYTGDLKREVEEYFKIHLPGVAKNEPKENAKGDGVCETCD